MDNPISNMTQICDRANKLYDAEEYEAAADLFLSLTEDGTYAPYAYYMLADIANITGDPLTSKDLYYKAFTLKPDLCSNMLPEDHPNYDYVFPGKKTEPVVEVCQLCGKAGEPIWSYATIKMGSKHVQKLNPVRMWMYCDICHHIYADEFPQIEGLEQGDDIDNDKTYTTYHSRFPHYSQIFERLASYTTGLDLLEVGLGACECSLVAREMGYNVFGVDILEGCVVTAKKFGIEAELRDFMDFSSDKQWDIIIFGDVLEHVSDPVAALNKLYELLKDNGALWISTPNFDSSYSALKGHSDAMRLEIYHKNYFSRVSLFNLLERCSFVPVNYQISKFYLGSMEVIAVKDVYQVE